MYPQSRSRAKLLVHGDTLLYLQYGRSVAEVNRAIANLLGTRDTSAWARLLDEFSEHRAFADVQVGPAHAVAFLDVFGGRQIIHGHTPISKLTGQPPEAVREPLVYARELCIDVDSGMYLGGPGFDYPLIS